MSVTMGNSFNPSASVSFSIKEGIINNTCVTFLTVSKGEPNHVKHNRTLLVNPWFSTGLLTKIISVVLK